MASEEGFTLRPDLRKKLEAISKKRAEKEAEEKATRQILRQKIVGVLVRQTRLKAGKSLKETAAVLDCSPERLSQYESGERALSLPEAEALARLFSVTLENLLDETRQEDKVPPPPPSELIRIRQKIIGVQLRLARQAADLTQKELGEATDIPPGRLSQYERGLRPIPLPELEILTEILDLDFDELVDEDLGPDSPQARRQRNIQRLSMMPEHIQDFVLSPVNAMYIEMAMQVSSLPVSTLRQIAEGLLDITY
jgi:transcriptional regulator with XRE-family HTH domain